MVLEWDEWDVNRDLLQREAMSVTHQHVSAILGAGFVCKEGHVSVKCQVFSSLFRQA